MPWSDNPRRLRSCCAYIYSAQHILPHLSFLPVQLTGTFPVHLTFIQVGLQVLCPVQLIRHID